MGANYCQEYHDLIILHIWNILQMSLIISCRAGCVKMILQVNIAAYQGNTGPVLWQTVTQHVHQKSWYQTNNNKQVYCTCTYAVLITKCKSSWPLNLGTGVLKQVGTCWDSANYLIIVSLLTLITANQFATNKLTCHNQTLSVADTYLITWNFRDTLIKVTRKISVAKITWREN